LEALLEKYHDVFRTELPTEKPTMRNVEHTIELEEGTNPIQAHQYLLPPKHQEVVQDTIKELL
jgi:hypothetical protein